MKLKRFVLAVGMLAILRTAEAAESSVTNVYVSHVNVGVRHDGDVLLVAIASQAAPNCHLDSWNDGFYIPLSDAKAKAIQANAMSAMIFSKQVTIQFDDAGTRTGMQGSGTTGCLIKNLLLKN